MNQLVFIEKGQAVTDSLTVAEVFGKEHKNVLADIRKQVDYAGEEFAQLNFQPGEYLDKNKQPRPKMNLSEEAFTLVAMSYNTKEAVQMKIKFIQEFKRMKEALMTISSPSYMIEDPIKRAQKWIEEQKERLMLEQQMKENEPKVTYYDLILQSKDVINITQIAKDYGLSGKILNQILNEEEVQYKTNGQWLLYSKHQDKGYTKSHTIEYRKSNGENGAKLHTKWTQKGRLFIHNLLSKRGIEPLIDREIDKKEA
ncbi:phage antirepressor KilAC domain-containing protein [Cytobacillus praedii]|uniref:phage antirepressor KilAC domain-containing protein n=1 Tax=Cytobacillus praedii TaxID=1742358 RepID=UPI002E1C2416|nr:phage antirepressor KilAC domain-containing protein [Cytobacillus praedii]MED3574525.1 phage antirepressor KilAC domain-containing protein [Cytobacillus praedii]